ncbi:hypothetical protein JQ629_30980 [Bradyrhizobium sp. AUGA SZCCT0222]|uniref:hypothetical protein n=1 Tax=Bradyrhizobium sp. AUGA SZCCT0222 TaxID=2807668 RepID=UPI001BA5D963|nr:hypothetical protein [Bradyrhizobium sp. AUGA SZCCT0222]MBR1271917.1 hypothetical protein [Bradyrhizobium sp. AUGA SZCCT0222]
MAIHENWTRGTFRLAVVALRADVRNEADVLALLRAPPPIRLNAVNIDEHAAAYVVRSTSINGRRRICEARPFCATSGLCSKA